MKKWIVTVILIVLLYVLQTTLFQSLSVAGAAPNLFIILLVVMGYRYGKLSGMMCGFITGLLLDFLDGTYIGLYALIYMLIGYFIGFANKIYYPDDITVPLVLIASSDLACNFIFYILFFLLRNRVHLFFYFRSIMLPEMLYTLILAIILYKPAHKLLQLVDGSAKEVM